MLPKILSKNLFSTFPLVLANKMEQKFGLKCVTIVLLWSKLSQGWPKSGFLKKTPLGWVFLGFIGFYWAFLGFIGFYWVLLISALPITGFYWVLLGFIGVFLGGGCYWFFFYFSPSNYWVLLGFIEFY